MQNKLINILILVAVLPGMAFAVIPVSVDLDIPAMINQVETMGQWAKQFEQWKQQIEQAKRVAAFANTLKEYAGDPSQAIAQLKDITKIRASLNLNLGDNMTVDAFASSVDSGSFFDGTIPNATITTPIGLTFRIGETTYQRDQSLYASNMQATGALAGTRRIIDANRKTEEQILAEAKEITDRLSSGNATESDKQRASMEYARLQLMTNELLVRNQAAATDLALNNERIRLAAIDQNTAAIEGISKVAAQQTKDREQLRNEAQAKWDAKLKTTTATAPDWGATFIK